jgi:hypothetical protein
VYIYTASMSRNFVKQFMFHGLKFQNHTHIYSDSHFFGRKFTQNSQKVTIYSSNLHKLFTNSSHSRIFHPIFTKSSHNIPYIFTQNPLTIHLPYIFTHYSHYYILHKQFIYTTSLSIHLTFEYIYPIL